MELIDEIRKKSTTAGQVWSTREVVIFTEIEKILGEMKCENCKYEKTCGILYFVGKTYVPFSCNQFERKQ